MSRGTQDILDQLPGIESGPRRLDRDARRALIVLGAVIAVAVGMAWQARETDESPMLEAASGGSDPFGALERIRVAPESAETATSPSDGGYESIDAIGPGRRS